MVAWMVAWMVFWMVFWMVAGWKRGAWKPGGWKRGDGQVRRVEVVPHRTFNQPVFGKFSKLYEFI